MATSVTGKEIPAKLQELLALNPTTRPHVTVKLGENGNGRTIPNCSIVEQECDLKGHEITLAFRPNGSPGISYGYYNPRRRKLGESDISEIHILE